MDQDTRQRLMNAVSADQQWSSKLLLKESKSTRPLTARWLTIAVGAG